MGRWPLWVDWGRGERSEGGKDHHPETITSGRCIERFEKKERKKKQICEPIGKIPTTPLYLIPETEDLERGLGSRFWGEDVSEVVGRPIAKEDESIVVSVDDKGAVPLEISQPLDRTVGMKNAIGEGELGAGWMDQVEEWNGERSDGGILLELEGAGGPVLLLFSADARLAIVWYIRPNLNDRTGVELSGFYRGGEGELTGMRGDV